MIRSVWVSCLLVVSGLAAAQDGGGVTFQPFNPGDFQNAFAESSTQVFIISDFRPILGALGQEPGAPSAPLDLSQLNEQQPLVEVEGYGVRLPDQQFQLTDK